MRKGISVSYSLDVFLEPYAFKQNLAADVRRGLTAPQKYLLPKYFYDDAGSKLFDRITELPEYYLTRTEQHLFSSVKPHILKATRPQEVVELGCGNGDKFRWLLHAARDREISAYIPMDMNAGLVESVARDLVRDYPFLAVHGIVGDFETHLAHIPPPKGRRLVTFMGSTIGNLGPEQRKGFIAQLRCLLDEGSHALIGLDLVKDAGMLEAAYNDQAGVTADFNRNILLVLNRELAGDFRPETFTHHAFFNREASRIEMHLVSRKEQQVRLAALEMQAAFQSDETIWTESSYKFTVGMVEEMLAAGGLRLEQWYTDEAGWYALALIGTA
ncbi:MAG: L-histidine N(alpha)-methyltransferase [Chloroflexi bacterium]|nr:L-histidine N(alpha)-methyltransferase [Chloroflexota bacterium]